MWKSFEKVACTTSEDKQEAKLSLGPYCLIADCLVISVLLNSISKCFRDIGP